MSTTIGSYFLDRDQPPLSSEEAEVVRQFQDLSFRHWLGRGADTLQLSWFGLPAHKMGQADQRIDWNASWWQKRD
jgi:hypothetical protein